MIDLDLEDLWKTIVRRPNVEKKNPYRLSTDNWIKMNQLAEEWCREKGRPFLSDEKLDRPNFIWGGVPVIFEVE